MTTLRRIEEISIENIKGIGKHKFSLALLPNKPNLLVAPNGFGKSSLAIAFQSLNKVRLDLHKDHLHKDDEKLIPVLNLAYRLDDNTLKTSAADNSKNEIAQAFDVFVINSQLVAKARKIKISGNLIVSSSLEVAPVDLVSKIPEKAKFTYSAQAARTAFGANGKALPSIELLLKNEELFVSLYEKVDFDRAHGARAKASIQALKDAINGASGTAENILAAVPETIVDDVAALPYISQALTILASNSALKHKSKLELILASVQLSDLQSSDKANFKKVATWYSYLREKKQYVEAFSALKGTWKNISPIEKKDSLVIEFPSASKLSNGERDSICFFAMLMQAKVKLKKSACILVIDEVFDYLDDANIVAAQYFITELIAEFKNQGRQLFPLILTHLDPQYFRSFVFNKPNIAYLNKEASPDRSVEKVIIQRSDPSVEAEISKYFLHFDPGSVDLHAQFDALGLSQGLSDSKDFAAHASGQLVSYCEGKPFDPISVCCAVRLMLEKWVHEKLDSSLRMAYLSTHKTPSRLEFGQANGVDVPEVFFLLGVIYNAAMHLRENADNFSPLRSKLGNLTIRHMICWARDFCQRP